MRDRRRTPWLGAASLLGALALACGLMSPEEDAAPSPGTPPVSGPSQDPLPPAGYSLVFADEFDGTVLDTTVWTPLEEQRRDALSTADAAAVRNGLLTVTTWTERGTHYTGFLSTAGKFEARYGYFEARIRFHSSPGSWCAFWLLSPSVGVPLGDPGTAGTEIDVVEHRVTDQSGWDALADMVAFNINWDGYDEHWKNVQRVVALPDGAPVQGVWHTYGVLWTETEYTFYVDHVPLWTTSTAVSHRAQDLRLTCEVDDATWAGDVPTGGYGSRATSVTKMEVDWVRAWQPG